MKPRLINLLPLNLSLMALQDFSSYRRNVGYASFMLLLATAIALALVSLQYSMTGDSISLAEIILGAIFYPYPIYVLFQIRSFDERSQPLPMLTLVSLDLILTVTSGAFAIVNGIQSQLQGDPPNGLLNYSAATISLYSMATATGMFLGLMLKKLDESH